VDPTLPAGYASMGLAQLETQADRLRRTVQRRRLHPGACSSGEDAENICAHYERLIEGLERQMEHIRRSQLQRC